MIAFLSSLPKLNPPSGPDEPLSEPKRLLHESTEDFDPDHCPDDRFMEKDLLLNMKALYAVPSRRRASGCMPLGFVKDFCLNKVFVKKYNDIDFPQALTGLDYLRDAEVGRRAHLREAAEKLGITEQNWREVLTKDLDAKAWVELAQSQELDIEIRYARVYLDLRIWVS